MGKVIVENWSIVGNVSGWGVADCSIGCRREMENCLEWHRGEMEDYMVGRGIHFLEG